MDENKEPDDGSGERAAVIDVHPPHEAAHNWRDILIHLATITIGLFIALSLEGCVEWQHHRHLVREARENIRSEMTDNQKTLRRDINAHGLNVTLSLNNSAMQNASWNTARETGAFSYMSYPEVKKYAEVYRLQELFADQTTRVTSAYTNSFSVLYIFDVDAKETPEVMRSDIASELQKLLAVQSELMLYNSIASGLDKEYSETLRQSF